MDKKQIRHDVTGSLETSKTLFKCDKSRKKVKMESNSLTILSGQKSFNLIKGARRLGKYCYIFLVVQDEFSCIFGSFSILI